VRTAVTLDALMDQEIAQDPLPPIDREHPTRSVPPS
jgi:hypothetical protein